jgi:ribosomal protein S18 acetylase RimI-like enzyme
LRKTVDRFYEHGKDQENLSLFLLAFRASRDTRLYPTIWRVRLLLSSRVWQPEKDTRIWEDETGQIIGFVMLWSRQRNSPYVVLDGYALPEIANEDLLTEMFAYGNERAEAISWQQKSAITVFANGFSQDAFSDQLQNVFGYVPVQPNPTAHNVYYAREMDEIVKIPSLPEGYTIQRLKDPRKLAAYQSLQSFAQVSPIHQRELIASAEYCHFMVVNPDEKYVAYCECSISRAEWEITKTRIGWIDYVETHPDHQQKGFGRVALMAGLAQLQKWGSDTAMLITINTNTPAIDLYNKVGFERVSIAEPLRYEKRITFSEV